jgi:hypothetical protein
MDSTELWLEPMIDEVPEPLSFPEIRHYLAHSRHDDVLGLRSLVEDSEAPPFASRRSNSRKARKSRA